MINKFNTRVSGYELKRRFAKFVEITQSKGHYAVQGHSRSPSYGQVFASERGVPQFNALVRVIVCQYRCRWYIAKI